MWRSVSVCVVAKLVRQRGVEAGPVHQPVNVELGLVRGVAHLPLLLAQLAQLLPVVQVQIHSRMADLCMLHPALEFQTHKKKMWLHIGTCTYMVMVTYQNFPNIPQESSR